MFNPQTVLKFVGVCSIHLRIFLENLRQPSVRLSSENFRNLRKIFRNVRMAFEEFWENLGKSSENRQKRRC